MQAAIIDVVTSEGQPASSSVAAYVERVYGYSYDFRWPALGVAAVFAVALRLLMLPAAKWRL